ncbi:cytochrome P450 2F2 [Sarcophilus harrisii]|uniref:cytochrome P450 2F2 n=1 Tax=Sarcophilus harrisii TaxID=9305 RepID=UPI001301F909|nr:cytochrome P450 2F2 [Sarcophilus harrisii]
MDWTGTVLLLLLLSITCLLLAKGVYKTKGRLPPGPRPLPLLGNLLQLRSRDMLASLTKLSQEYGPIFTVHLGTKPVVVLSGYEAVKEALVDKAEEFSGRGEYPVFHDFTKGNGIAFSNGEKWKVLRRFSIQILRNFGMGKKSIEERILEEEAFLLEELKKTEGTPFDPTFVLSRSVSNIICSVIFGSRFDYEDERLLKIIHLINDNFKIMSSPWGEMYNIFPGLLQWIPGPHHRLFQNFGCMKALIDQSIHEHQARLDPSSPSDFIDCFLIKMAEEAKSPDTHFHMETLVKTTHNLLFGGTETVGTTLRHGFLLLMKYPHIQARVQEEIDRVVGRGRRPTLEDRPAMPLHRPGPPQGGLRTFPITCRTSHPPGLPFLHPSGGPARLPALLPPSLPLQGSSLAQGPEESQPQPSAGPGVREPGRRRLCLGEPLARMELFLYLTGILQNFTLHPLCPIEEIDVTPLSSGLGNVPRPFQLRMLPR